MALPPDQGGGKWWEWKEIIRVGDVRVLWFQQGAVISSGWESSSGREHCVTLAILCYDCHIVTHLSRVPNESWVTIPKQKFCLPHLYLTASEYLRHQANEGSSSNTIKYTKHPDQAVGSWALPTWSASFSFLSELVFLPVSASQWSEA